jgi:hypothetical protein
MSGEGPSESASRTPSLPTTTTRAPTPTSGADSSTMASSASGSSMFSAPMDVAMPWAWRRALLVTSVAARRWSVIVRGRPRAMISTMRMYPKTTTSRVRTFVAASYASSGARNRNPTPRIVVM